MVIYSGTFERSLDSKNRVTIPARWLAGEGEEFHVVPNHQPENFLSVMPAEEFSAIENRIEQSAELSPRDKRRAIRSFYSMARAVSVDKQGRILLPEEHCREIGLKGDVVLAGTKSRFEIWSRDCWEKAHASSRADFEKIADLIGL